MAIKNIFKKKQWRSDFEAGSEAYAGGDFRTAEGFLRQALTKAISLDDTSYGDTTLLLGQVVRRLERLPESLELTKKAFQYYRGLLGLHDARTVSSHLAVVLADPTQGDDEGSLRVATYRKAIEQFGGSSWQAMRTAALALAHLPPLEVPTVLSLAEEACDHALGAGRAQLGTWPPVAQELSAALAGAGNLAGASRLMVYQVRIFEERFGERSEQASVARLILGEYLLAEGQWLAATEVLSKSYEDVRLKHGSKSALGSRACLALGQALARVGQLAKAAPFLRDALEKLTSERNFERVELLVWLLEYRCMVAATDAERGALWRDLERAWEDDPTDDLIRERIVEGFRAAQRRLQEAWELGPAERFLQVVLQRVRQWRGAHHPDVATILMDLAGLLAWRDEDAKAVRYADESLAMDKGLGNTIAAVGVFGTLGDRSRGLQYAKDALGLLEMLDPGLKRARYQATLAQALLGIGESGLALIQASQALPLLPSVEAGLLRRVLAEANLYEGDWVQACDLYRQAIAELVDPTEGAKARLGYAWLLSQLGQFVELQAVVSEVTRFWEIRPDHPQAWMAKALLALGASCNDQTFQAKQERDATLAFLRSHQHQQTRRALSLLCWLPVVGRDDVEAQLDLGTQILSASRFPEAVCTRLPVKDVACLGLRHLVGGFFQHGQTALAEERLQQYRDRFLAAYGDLHSPFAGFLHLSEAMLASSSAEQIVALEAGLHCFLKLHERHRELFPTMVRLAEAYLDEDQPGKARQMVSRALEIRKSPRLQMLVTRLDEMDKATLATRIDAPVDVPEAYQEPPHTEDESLVRIPRGTLPSGLDALELEDSGTLVAYAGASDVTKIPLARALVGRDEPPSRTEVEEVLAEVHARFGDDRRARKDTQLTLALLFGDGSDLALELWNAALDEVFQEDFETLLELENRARDAKLSTLVLATLRRRLYDEVERYGDQATESLGTLSRLALVLEARGELDEAYQRVSLALEIQRSWFGSRSRRLLEPLAHLIRLAERRGDAATALIHYRERQEILESGEASPSELALSKLVLLPILALLGRVEELMHQAQESLIALRQLEPSVASSFAETMLGVSARLDHVHWRVVEADKLLDWALSVVPENEVSLWCRLLIARAQCQTRRDYLAQADALRMQVVTRLGSVESEVRAEILWELADSCVRVHELARAREFAEKLLEERIALNGRKDVWAGNALLILAQTDLQAYRLEGAEAAIAMSRPALEGSPQWKQALRIQAQTKFFLGSFAETSMMLGELGASQAWGLRLALAGWSRESETLLKEFDVDGPLGLARRWRDLESIPLGEAAQLLEFLERAGQVRRLEAGLSRLGPRLEPLASTDSRLARFLLIQASLAQGEGRLEQAEGLLTRALDALASEGITVPDGQLSLKARGQLVDVLLAQNKVHQAELQASAGMGRAAELLGEEDVHSLAFRIHLAVCADARGDHEGAMITLDEVLGQLQERLGDTHILLREVYRGLARAFLSQQEWDSARMTAEEALRLDKECRGLSWHYVQDLHLLAQIERNGDLGEAIDVLQAVERFAIEVLPKGHPYLEKLDRELVEFEELERQKAQVETSVEASLGEAELDGWQVLSDGEELAPSFDAVPKTQSATVGDTHGNLADDSFEFEPSLEGWEVVAELEPETDHADIESLKVAVPHVDEPEATTAPEPELETDHADIESLKVAVSHVDEPETMTAPEPELETDHADIESLKVAVSHVDEPEAMTAPEPEIETDHADIESLKVGVPHVDEPEATTASEPEIEACVTAENSVEVFTSGRHQDSVAPKDLLMSRRPLFLAEDEAFRTEPQKAEASIESTLDFPPLPYRGPVLLEETVLQVEELKAARELWNDPETIFLPLGPVFFLDLPWSEAWATVLGEPYLIAFEAFCSALERGGDWTDAWEQAMGLARLHPSPASGQLLLVLGRQLERLGHDDQANACLIEAVEWLESGVSLGAACHLAGRLAGRRGEFERALEYFERAAELAERMELAVLKVDAAECHLGQGRPEEALIGYEEVVDYLSDHLPSGHVLAVRAKLAQVHLFVGDPDTSLALSLDLKSFGEAEPGDQGMALGWAFLSRIFARLGLYEDSLELICRSWGVAKDWQREHRKTRRVILSHLLDAYRLKGSIAEARLLLADCGFLGWGLGELELLVRAGSLALIDGDGAVAQSYSKLGHALVHRWHSPSSWLVTFLELDGWIALEQGDLILAEALIRRAIKLSEGEGSGPLERSRLKVRVAQCAFLQARVDDARRAVLEAQELREAHLGSNHPHVQVLERLAASF